MLSHNPRPGEDGSLAPPGRWPIAWKTGTSWGFRDAWSAGIVGPYILVVWIGDFEAQGNPSFVGADAAAPLFFRIADALNLQKPDEIVKPPAAAAGGEQSGSLRGERRPAQQILPSNRGDLVHSGQVAHPGKPVAPRGRPSISAPGFLPAHPMLRTQPGKRFSNSGHPT